MSTATIKQVSETPKEFMDEMMAKIESLANKVSRSDEWLSIEEAASYIKKSTYTMIRLKKQIGYSKPERDLLFKKSDLDAYLNRHYHEPQLTR